MMKSISSTRSLSRAIVYSLRTYKVFSRSQIASSNISSIFWNEVTCKRVVNDYDSQGEMSLIKLEYVRSDLIIIN